MTAVQRRLGQIGVERHQGAPAMPEQRASPSPQDELHRRLSLSGLACELFKRSPATMCYLSAVWVAGLATGSIAHGPPGWLSGYRAKEILFGESAALHGSRPVLLS